MRFVALIALVLTVPGAAAGQAAAREAVPRSLVYDIAPTRSGERELAVDLYAPRTGPVRGAVVLMHGGAFVSGSRDLEENRAYGEALAERGYLAAAISYRLHGDAPVVDGWASRYAARVREHPDPRVRGAIEQHGLAWAEAVAAAAVDLSAAVTWLRSRAAEFGFQPADIAVFGASAGAITALTTAYALDVYGGEPVPVAAVISLRGLLLDPGDAGPVFEAGDPPLMILHGEADERVPLANADSLFGVARAAGVPVRHYSAPGHGHELGGRELLDLGTDGRRGTVLDRLDQFLASAFAGEIGPRSSRRGTLRPQAAETGGFLFAYRPLRGERAAFEDGYRRHLEWHRTHADSLLWYGWDVMAGPRLGMFVDGTFGRPFAALDDRVDPSGDAADADRTFEPHVEPTGRELMRLRSDLSGATPLEDTLPTAFVEVVRYRAGPGALDRLEDAFATLARGPGSRSLLPYTVYESIAGAEPGFLVMIFREDLGTFDALDRDPQRALRERLRDGDGTDTVELDLAVTRELWRYRSDLTYLGSEEDP